jgi:head-tail adaptor
LSSRLYASQRDCHLTVQRAAKPWPQDQQTRQPIPAWEDFCHPWAARRAPTGRETPVGQQLVSLESLVFEVPSDSRTRLVTADEQWRIRFGERYYDIKAAAASEKRRHHIDWFVEARAEAAQ